MDKNASGWLGFLGLAGCIAAALFLRRSAPFLSGILLFAVIAVLVLLLLLVVIVIYFAFQKPKGSEEAAILTKGRKNLMELRSITMRIRSEEIRSLSNQICSGAEKILKVLKEKPGSIPALRQFFNYYLPTLGSILTTYLRIEKSGVPAQDMEQRVIAYLGDIRSAMDKQYTNLFEDDMLDLTVEMEAMTMACRMDGLLSEEGVQIQDGERKIDLTL